MDAEDLKLAVRILLEEQRVDVAAERVAREGIVERRVRRWVGVGRIDPIDDQVVGIQAAGDRQRRHLGGVGIQDIPAAAEGPVDDIGRGELPTPLSAVGWICPVGIGDGRSTRLSISLDPEVPAKGRDQEVRPAIVPDAVIIRVPVDPVIGLPGPAS